MTIEDASAAELRALLRLADANVADCAAVLSEAIAMRDMIRAALAVREGAEDAGFLRLLSGYPVKSSRAV